MMGSEIRMCFETPPLFHPNFGVVPIGLDCQCWGADDRRPYANYACNYFSTNPTYMATAPERYRRTDGGQTDDLL